MLPQPREDDLNMTTAPMVLVQDNDECMGKALIHRNLSFFVFSSDISFSIELSAALYIQALHPINLVAI